jgi:hypothetical protein
MPFYSGVWLSWAALTIAPIPPRKTIILFESVDELGDKYSTFLTLNLLQVFYQRNRTQF